MKHVVVRCESPDRSVIKKKAGDYTGQNYSTIDIANSSDLAFVNCGWDGNMQNITETEQAHTLNILASDISGAPSTGIRVLGNVFTNVHGDGVRFVGSTVSHIENAIVARNTFDVSRRSGIGVQRGIRNMWFVENKFSNITDQYIDFEPTGGEDFDPPSEILIADSLFSQHMNDSYVMSVGGLGHLLAARHIVVKNNVMYGSVIINDLEDSSFIDNVIDASAPNLRTTKSDGTAIGRSTTDNFALHSIGYAHNVRFQGGKIIGKDRGVYVVHHNDGIPQGLVFDGVEFKAARGLDLHSASDIYVVNSKLTYAPFAKTQFVDTTTGELLPPRGVYLESERPETNLKNLVVANDTIDGFARAVQVNARSGNTITGVKLDGDTYLGPADGVFFTKAGPVLDVTKDGQALP